MGSAWKQSYTKTATGDPSDKTLSYFSPILLKGAYCYFPSNIKNMHITSTQMSVQNQQ